MKTNDPIYIGHGAIDHLIDYCQQHNLTQFTLVADENTFEALGAAVESALKARQFDLTTIVLKGDEIVADERYLMKVLLDAPVAAHTYIAIGSGTITDIARFISYRTRNPFISLPTAPSVDGFTSVGAPLVVEGVKRTFISQAPLAIFADLPTLQAAPRRLIAAGFGDMIGKITSLADWELGRLLWDEPYDDAIARRAQKAVTACLNHADEIAAADEAGIRHLMDGLMESGLCMLEFGSSRPASGSEHHCSHYWEMLLLQEGRPAILHGAKVGVATTIIADLYERIRAMSRAEIEDVLARAPLPNREREIEIIRSAYGPVADLVIEGQADYLDLTLDGFERLKQRVLDRWDGVQAIAAAVPPGEEISTILNKVGAPTSGQELGLSSDEMRRGVEYGHYLRARFTVRKFYHLLGLDALESV